jgi:peptidoglycan/LPS O-acetylase OafA/YrhL
MTAKARQLPIDALKVIASQLIVLHHLSAYGPVANTLSQTAPLLMGWLYDYARMAVQVFLVVGGYLAAASLAPASPLRHALLSPLKRRHTPLQAVIKRYRRLVLPCLAALVLAVASAALARHWMDEAFIPSAPNWAQSLAHVFLLQSVLGHDALSAGVWYVAIDFQLFVLMTLLMWLGQRRHRTANTDQAIGPGLAQTLMLGLVVSLMLASLFFFNRDPTWDNWALYFFGAYGMGATAFWAGGSRRPALYLGGLALTGTLALVLEFRERIALALGVALALGLWHWGRSATPCSFPNSLRHITLPPVLTRVVHQLGQSSYALFLVHFPVLMMGNALYVKLGLNGPVAAAWVMLACWVNSLALAQVFERWVEAPLARY